MKLKKIISFTVTLLIFIETALSAATIAEEEFSRELFDQYLPEIESTFEDANIIQKGSVDGESFSFTINLDRWERNTSKDQIVMISRLFWQCYPRMYKRFGKIMESPREVTLAIRNEDYEVAWAAGNFVHLHDCWLKDNPVDFDCLTHEFSHVIQNGWEGEYLEYDSYIETFADYCRFVYAFNDGYYNDYCWTLQSVKDQSSREDSVRFLVWLDRYYSSPDNDIILKFADAARNRKVSKEYWDFAWAEIFSGSELENKTIDEVWKLYTKSRFAHALSFARPGKKSPVRKMYNQK